MLKTIKADDLLFSNEIEDDRTNTFVSLNDYDWMEYTIKTSFKTEELGILKIEFVYFGMTRCQMNVTQLFNKKVTEYTYEYDTSIFQKYLVEFLTNHINSWNSQYAFNGEDEVIAFYNEVIKNGTITNKQERDPDEYELKLLQSFNTNYRLWKELKKEYVFPININDIEPVKKE